MTDERLREEQTAPDERLREEQTAPDERSGEEQITRAVDAVVLVGGQGTRLRPLTLSAPKPMLPTAGLPFLTHLLSRIAAAGIEHVVLGTSYKPHVFEAEFGDGSKLGLEIEYVTESEPLGTGGAIANVAKKLRHDTVMVFNGDVLSGADLAALLDSHASLDSDVTLHLVRVGDPRAFGCVPTDNDGLVTAFLEKTQDPPTDQINAGCYVFRRSVIDRIPVGRPVSVEREVFPALLSEGLRVCGYVDSSYWRDMGTPEDFVRGSADLVRGIAPSPALGGQRGEKLVHDGAAVSPGALLIGGTVVGRGAEIGPGVRLDGAVIFDGVRVEAGSVIERSIIGFGARIGPRALIRDGVIGDGAEIGARCELLRGARVWPGVKIPDGGIRYSTDV
ncbi:MAG: mannose-phosphate guanylyltransferase [Mycobacterium sp.]|jgi:mannose-1-phosphate guanylyltransferase|nr:mannose-phosphate guanylyltransferase [Mycobacterium sp.]